MTGYNNRIEKGVLRKNTFFVSWLKKIKRDTVTALTGLSPWYSHCMQASEVTCLFLELNLSNINSQVDYLPFYRNIFKNGAP
jgi:hypothetical protein